MSNEDCLRRTYWGLLEPRSIAVISYITTDYLEKIS